MQRSVFSVQCSAYSVHSERGAAFLLTFLMMLVLSGLALAAGIFGQNSLLESRGQLLDKQAFYIAEAGWQRARQQLTDENWTASAGAGTIQTEDFDDVDSNKLGEYKVTMVDNGDSTYTITSEGYVPDQTNTLAKRKVVEAALSVTSGPTNLSLDAAASASSVKGNNTADKVNDDDTGSHWTAQTKGSGEWLALDYGSATTIDQMIILEDGNIDGVSVESSSDGSTWSVVTGLSVTESPAKTWTIDFDATSAQHFRAVLTSSGSKKRVGIDEFRSFDTSAGSVTTLGAGNFYTQW